MSAKKRQPPQRRTSAARLQELIEEATVDCHDEDEQHSGILTLVQENVVCPFKAKVIGEEIEVTDLEWPDEGFGLKAVCTRKGKTHRVDVSSLEWIDPLPEGFEWIEAYLEWKKTID